MKNAKEKKPEANSEVDLTKDKNSNNNQIANNKSKQQANSKQAASPDKTKNPKDKDDGNTKANISPTNNISNSKDRKNSTSLGKIQNDVANKVTNTGRKTPTSNALNKRNAKGQIIQEEVEIQPPPPKEKNLERFIHITNYKDHESINIFKELFETINKQAFDLKSAKEIYTRDLTEEEQDNNNIDYITGFQMIDSNTRITIIEGISEKSMKIVKEKLPKICLNNNTKKIFSNSKFLCDTRLYTQFGLCLKLIKLRNTLSEIISNYDIYSKANKYREIYNAFMNIGFILKSSTFQEISDANLFPTAESLLMLERKYADILNNEDITGIPSEIKIPKKKTKREDISREKFANTNISMSTTLYSLDVKDLNALNLLNESDSISNSQNLNKTKSQRTRNANNANNNSNKNKTNINIEEQKKESIKPKLDSRNDEFDKIKKQSEMNKLNSHLRNLNILKNLNSKAKTNKFCKRIKDKEPESKFNLDFDLGSKNENSIDLSISQSQNSSFLKQIQNTSMPKKEEILFYSNLKKNYYINYLEKLREDYLKEKNNYYTYSLDHLTLSFPMISDKNHIYEEYIENKKKWRHPQGKDFERYKQPNKEYIYLPKIRNEL